MLTCLFIPGAGASALLHASVELRTGCSAAGAAAAALFGLSPLQWRYSVQADVFGLSNLLASAILLTTTLNFRHRSTRASMLTAFICGLSLTNQHTAIFLVLPVAIAVLAVLAAGHNSGGRVMPAFAKGLLVVMSGAVGKVTSQQRLLTL
jgi:hypothetical protein